MELRRKECLSSSDETKILNVQKRFVLWYYNSD